MQDRASTTQHLGQHTRRLGRLRVAAKLRLPTDWSRTFTPKPLARLLQVVAALYVVDVSLTFTACVTNAFRLWFDRAWRFFLDMITKLTFQQQTGGVATLHRKNPYIQQLDSLLDVYAQARESGPQMLTAMAIVRQCKGFLEDLKKRDKTSRKQDAVLALHSAALAVVADIRGQAKRGASIAKAQVAAQRSAAPSAVSAYAHKANANATMNDTARPSTYVPKANDYATMNDTARPSTYVPKANDYATMNDTAPPSTYVPKANDYATMNDTAPPSTYQGQEALNHLAPIAYRSSAPAPVPVPEEGPYDLMAPELSSQEALQRNLGTMRRFANILTPARGGVVQKSLDKKYWLEAMDPQHRMGDHLKAVFKDWENANTNLNFYDWVDEVWLPLDSGTQLGVELRYQKVTYLTTEEERQEYEILIRGGQFTSRLNNTPFSTSKMRTAFSGGGTAIFVATPDKRFFRPATRRAISTTPLSSPGRRCSAAASG